MENDILKQFVDEIKKELFVGVCRDLKDIHDIDCYVDGDKILENNGNLICTNHDFDFIEIEGDYVEYFNPHTDTIEVLGKVK